MKIASRRSFWLPIYFSVWLAVLLLRCPIVFSTPTPTAAKLRLLADAKNRALANEDYLTAKEIKAVESELKVLGAKLAQLDLAKREAVRCEDYDRAKDIKDDCDEIRRQIEKKVR
jgi:hypothetical protein